MPPGTGGTLPTVSEERRCPTCGALVSADAEWCGQCFSDLRPRPVPAVPAQPPAEVVAAPSGVAAPAPADDAVPPPGPDAPAAEQPFWPCTVCGEHNPIAVDVCDTCGTPFVAVMRGTPTRNVDPAAARRRSMLFPGAGHTLLGYGTDGFARGCLFVVSLAVALFLLTGAPHTPAILFVVVVCVGLAGGVYVVSLLEIDGLAERGALLVPSKYLLWTLVVVMFLVVGAIGLSVATTARR